jgi:hypothetical protein
VLVPGSKLAVARALRRETAHSSLGAELGLEAVDEDDLYPALDWLLPQRSQVEAALAGEVKRKSTAASKNGMPYLRSWCTKHSPSGNRSWG